MTFLKHIFRTLAFIAALTVTFDTRYFSDGWRILGLIGTIWIYVWYCYHTMAYEAYIEEMKPPKPRNLSKRRK